MHLYTKKIETFKIKRCVLRHNIITLSKTLFYYFIIYIIASEEHKRLQNVEHDMAQLYYSTEILFINIFIVNFLHSNHIL